MKWIFPRPVGKEPPSDEMIECRIDVFGKELINLKWRFTVDYSRLIWLIRLRAAGDIDAEMMRLKNGLR